MKNLIHLRTLLFPILFGLLGAQCSNTNSTLQDNLLTIDVLLDSTLLLTENLKAANLLAIRLTKEAVEASEDVAIKEIGNKAEEIQGILKAIGAKRMKNVKKIVTAMVEATRIEAIKRNITPSLGGHHTSKEFVTVRQELEELIASKPVEEAVDKVNSEIGVSSLSEELIKKQEAFSSMINVIEARAEPGLTQTIEAVKRTIASTQNAENASLALRIAVEAITREENSIEKNSIPYILAITKIKIIQETATRCS